MKTSTIHSGRKSEVYPVGAIPEEWGMWFIPLKDSEMKQTNLNIFYHLGAALTGLREVSTGMDRIEFFIKSVRPLEWLRRLLAEIEGVPMPDTRRAAEELLVATQFCNDPKDISRPMSQEEVITINQLLQEFEKEFEREHDKLSVFTVTPKGIYDTKLLAESAEDKFPEHIRKHFSDTFLYDLRQAGRCLAFEVPTASAFHIFRATESLIRDYYETLSGHPWPHVQRDWGRYISELNKLPGVSKDVTMRLDEIRNFERNPSIHPEHIVSRDKAPTLFELCSGVIYTMAEEIGKKKP